MTRNIDAIFTRFVDLLDSRFSNQVTTTEDSVRYTMFAALLEAGVQPHEVVLEYPHPVIPRAQIDTWIPSFENDCHALEFKYDRDPPGGMNQPKTQKAAAVFRDIHRQLLVSQGGDVKCYFVYVTSEEMTTYFRNPNNGYHDFFSLPRGETLRLTEGYFDGKPMTFTNALGGAFSADVESVLSCDLDDGNHVRIYQIREPVTQPDNDLSRNSGQLPTARL